MIVLDLVWGSRVLLATFFVVAAVSQVIDGGRHRIRLASLPIPSRSVGPGRWIVIALASGLAVILMIGSSFAAGMLAFLAFSGLIVLFIRSPDDQRLDAACRIGPEHTKALTSVDRVPWWVGGALLGLVIAASAPVRSSQPTLAGVLLAAGAVTVAVLMSRVDHRRQLSLNIRSQRDIDQAKPDSQLERRAFLHRAVTFSVGTGAFLIPLSRAFACGGGTEFGCTSGLAAQSTAPASTHSEKNPCFRVAAIYKVTGDCQAADQFDLSVKAAGVDNTKLLASADSYRLQMIAYKTEFEKKAAACT